MSKKRRNTPSPQVKDESKAVFVTKYEITASPIMDRAYKKLPEKVKDAIERLHYESQSKPFKAIPELLDLLKKYPQLPILYNFLSAAYMKAGRREQAEAVIQENYRRNPDYLFARLNYAELFLEKGDYEQVAEILEHKFDLKLLYPQRNRFHISEVANFMGLVGIYWVKIGKREAALKYYELLQQVAPDYPMTKRLRRTLFPGLLQRLLGQR